MKGVYISLGFIILGILIKYGKMYFLIAGYNTMSKKEKANYNIDGIATVFKNVMFFMGILIALGGLGSIYFQYENLQPISIFTSTIIGVPYLLIKVNSKEFRISNKD